MKQTTPQINFYKKFGKITLQTIKKVEAGPQYDEQPAFLKFFNINDVPHAFFGDESLDSLKRLVGFKFQTFHFFIPPQSRLVDVRSLGELLDTEKTNDRELDKAFIDMENTMFNLFYPGKIEDRIMVNICANINKFPYDPKAELLPGQQEIHFCDNFSDHLPVGNFLSIQGGFCDLAITSTRPPSVEKSSTSSEENQALATYQPLLFYIDIKEIEQEVLECMALIFPEITSPGTMGIFLLPLKDPNLGISFYCLPNANDYVYGDGVGIKECLYSWVTGIQNLNTQMFVPAAAVKDPLFLPIDPWSCSFYRRVHLVLVEDVPKLSR